MWSQTFSKVYPGITKEAVWSVWADVNNYLAWHDDLDYCRMTGEFVVGNYFMLKPKGAPAVKIEITELVKNQRFVDCTSFFGAKMYDIHELEETADGVRITSTVKVTGFLSFLWVKLVAKKVAESAPAEAKALIALIEEKQHAV